MTTENMKKARFDQLGLPPMELAESSANSRNNNGIYKYLFPTLQKLMIILLLTILGAGTYVLLSKILESYDITKSTQIIYIKDNSEPTNTIHYSIRLFNTTSDTEMSRKKRNTDALTNTDSDSDAFNSINFNEDQLEKAREIIMKHDTLCSEEEKDSICKDLVTKLKELTNNDSPRREEERSKITIGMNDIDDSTQSKLFEITTTAKREVVPTHVDNTIETIPQSFDFTNLSEYGHPHSSLYDHRGTDNCLLNLLKKHPRVKDYLDPTNEDLTHNEAHYDRPLIPQARYYSPTIHTSSYKQTRNVDVPRRKMHPQDVDILMSFLTPKSEATASERPSNFTREVSCPPDTVACLNAETCIDKKQWCDGHVDCDDVSDEARCNCKSRVDKSRLCDGYFDCPFGEDELGCYGCSESTFSCEDLDINSHSTCFSKEQRCNNVADCPNRKDEIECNMLASTLLKKPIFAVSNTEGFLHRNFKGEWYAVCKNPYMWAHDACRREAGLIIRPPFIQIVPVDPMLKMNYINTDPGGLMQKTDNCLNSSAIYVTCPDFLCGTRVQSSSQIMRENSAIENQLYGRNKRFLQTKHPYPLKFYSHRQKRDVDDFTSKTNYGVKFDTSNIASSFDKMRNKRTESRVVGGKPSQPAAWPWLVAVYRDGMFHCGGVIMSHNWVISAAHCVHKFWDHYYEVQVGMLRRFSFSPQEQSHKVTHVIVNQQYTQTDMQNDLSLLRVEPTILYSRWVRPICLPSPDTAGPDWIWGPLPGTECTAVGWGATTEHGPDPDHMREVEVPIWEKCKYKEDRAGKEICAGYREGGKDACQGDSGGPLLCRNPLNSEQWYLAGIVSHGDGCGRKGEPGVYTRVSLFVKWIKYHTASHDLPIIQPIQDCPGFKCESGISKCLPNKRKCDRIVDCLDGEDEVNCEFRSTVSTFADNILSNNFTEEIFAAKEAKPESILPENEASSTTFSIESFTIGPEKKSSTNSINIENNQNEDLQKSAEDIVEPDFQHSSTIEMSISKSVEESSFNDENVTSHPDDTASRESNTQTRGDTESIAVEVIGESLESRSSLNANERLREPTTVREIDEIANPKLEIKEQIPEATRNFSMDLEITTQINLHENNEIPIIPTDNIEKNQHDIVETNSDGLKVDLLPKSHSGFPDQTGADTEHVTRASTSLNKNHSTDGLTKPLSDIDFETIVTSELQPATLRRKHHIPKEFQCQRINQIVPYHHRCDRKADCEDGTDELGCSCIDYLATFDEKLICDGNYDCADGHDETSCYSCAEEQFLCKRSQICLPFKNVCDGKPQCPEGEDELDCYALTNGKEIEFGIDERPNVNLEGYLTKRHHNGWHVVCDEKLSLEQQDQAATNICRYLGFSSANKYFVKYVNLKEDEIAKQSLDIKRIKRDVTERIPVHFVYRQVSEDNDITQNVVINDAQVIKEECVPNITKTCKSLYVACDRSLFTDFEEHNSVFLRNTDFATEIWPWVAKIFIEGEYKCTGVLIDLSWVLVSEACLWDSMLAHHYITVVLGSHRTLEGINGMHEQVYQVDAKKDIFRNKVTLLHLKQPAFYSNVVKPMTVSSSFTYLDPKSTCVAIGEDDKNNTLSIFVKETNDNCIRSNRCFVRKSNVSVCPPKISSNRHWAGIISCHTDDGWFPTASFVDSRGECGLGDHINATDIENLKYVIKHVNSHKLIPLVGKGHMDDCEGIRCGRGRCISLSNSCDGIRHCEDGYDESEEACIKKKFMCITDPYSRGCECASGQMKCRNGKCVSKEMFKDGNNDCGDGTDEPGQSTCSHYLARAMPSRLCDGILHCDDRSDEDPLFCKCFAKQTFKCGKKSRVDYCVPPDTVCDGIRDCPNGEDEQTCIGLNAPHGTPHGTGQVIVRSHGVWHSKCYSTQNHTKSELEAICAELGFIGGHAKQIHQLEEFIFHPYNTIVVDKFSDINLNNNTIIKMRNKHEPIAKPVYDEELQDCYPVFIECL